MYSLLTKLFDPYELYCIERCSVEEDIEVRIDWVSLSVDYP